MIDFQNIQNHKWDSTRISIIGAGKSGIAAAKMGQHLGSKIFISDSDNSSEILQAFPLLQILSLVQLVQMGICFYFFYS